MTSYTSSVNSQVGGLTSAVAIQGTTCTWVAALDEGKGCVTWWHKPSRELAGAQIPMAAHLPLVSTLPNCLTLPLWYYAAFSHV